MEEGERKREKGRAIAKVGMTEPISTVRRGNQLQHINFIYVALNMVGLTM